MAIPKEILESWTLRCKAWAKDEGIADVGEDVDIHKFLVGRAGNQEQAFSQFQQACKWRRDTMKIDSLLEQDFSDYDKKGLIYIPPNLRAKDGTKLGFFRSWEHLPKTSAVTERAFQYIVYCLERARRDNIIIPGDKLTIIYDRSYATRANMDFTLMRQVISSFQIAYPEWLARFIFFPTNMFVQAGWTIAKTILDPATTDKLRLLSTSDWQQVVHELVDPSQLPRRYKGTYRDKFDLAECEGKQPNFSKWQNEGYEN